MKKHLITATTIGILALLNFPLHAQATQQQQNPAIQSPLSSNTTPTDSGKNKEQPHSIQEERERAQGWHRFWDFYRTPDSEVRKLTFSGPEQEYANEYISLKWDLGETNQSTSRTLSYQWLNTTEPVTLLNLPESINVGGTVILRKRYHVIEFHYGPGTDVAIHENILRPTYFVASNVLAPLSTGTYDKTPNVITFPATEEFGAIVNDCAISMRDGVVYAHTHESNEPIRIGTAAGDNRPVGTMQIGIETLDQLTSAVQVWIKNSYYPHTLFATDQPATLSKLITNHAGDLAYKSELINSLAQTYGFKISWADEATQKLADTSVHKPMHSQSGNPQAVLHWIELILGEDFAPVAKSHDELYIALSSKYHANLEFNQFAQTLQTDFKMDTRLYTIKHLGTALASSGINRLLGCYFIGKPSSTDVTTQTLKASGKYWSILKYPQRKIGEAKAQQEIDATNTVICENLNDTIRTTSEGDVFMVTATAETHDQIAEWLNAIEADMEQRSLPAIDEGKLPERRRLQIVLLQGGQVGEAASVVDETGTSVTYQADVPEQFGMTPDDLNILGFDGAVVSGRGIIDLLSIPGEGGSASLTLGNEFSFSVQFQQEQGGYLVIEATLQQSKNSSTPLAQNTMMLEKDKPTFLGVTNLAGAVIVIVTWI